MGLNCKEYSMTALHCLLSPMHTITEAKLQVNQYHGSTAKSCLSLAVILCHSYEYNKTFQHDTVYIQPCCNFQSRVNWFITLEFRYKCGDEIGQISLAICDIEVCDIDRHLSRESNTPRQMQSFTVGQDGAVIGLNVPRTVNANSCSYWFQRRNGNWSCKLVIVRLCYKNLLKILTCD